MVRVMLERRTKLIFIIFADDIIKELIEVLKEDITRNTNTTIIVYKNGTNLVYNGEKPDVDASEISITFKKGWNNMKDVFEKAFDA